MRAYLYGTVASLPQVVTKKEWTAPDGKVFPARSELAFTLETADGKHTPVVGKYLVEGVYRPELLAADEKSVRSLLGQSAAVEVDVYANVGRRTYQGRPQADITASLVTISAAEAAPSAA